jgi:hypothetical protein
MNGAAVGQLPVARVCMSLRKLWKLKKNRGTAIRSVVKDKVGPQSALGYTTKQASRFLVSSECADAVRHEYRFNLICEVPSGESLTPDLLCRVGVFFACYCCRCEGLSGSGCVRICRWKTSRILPRHQKVCQTC